MTKMIKSNPFLGELLL